MANESTASITTEKKKKAPPANLVIPPKAPTLTKAERRALQEQQRAAKTGVLPPTTTASTTASASEGKTNVQQQHHQQSFAGKPSVNSADAKPKQQEQQQQQENCSESVIILPTIVAHLTPPLPALFDTGAVLKLIHASSTAVLEDGTNGLRNPTNGLHPAVLKLGYQYATGAIRGGNARCRAMLECFAVLLRASVVTTAAAKEYKEETEQLPQWSLANVDSKLFKPAFTFWTEHCRPHSVAMGNAYAFLKATCSNSSSSSGSGMDFSPFDASSRFQNNNPLPSWPAVVESLVDTIYAYIRERIDYALSAIAEIACTKLLYSSSSAHSEPQPHNNGTRRSYEHYRPGGEGEQVLLTFGYSEAVCAVLTQAAAEQQQHQPTERGSMLRVICVDSPPLWEGRRMLQKLQPYITNLNDTAIGGSGGGSLFACTYIHLSALTYVLPTVTKVLLGAAALQSDGSVTGRVGTAVVAMAAHTFRRCPVLFCAETYKISNRGVQLEGIAQNELLSCPRSNTRVDATGTNKNSDSINKIEAPIVDLLYDLTPASYVSGIVTELGIVPPTSIAVLLREMNPDYKR